jgi:hypothetical protein
MTHSHPMSNELMSLRNLNRIFIIVLGFIFVQSCTEVPNQPVGNQPPHTFLSLFPDSTISPHSTSLKITWWGDDPDGFVAGYYFSFDSLNWNFTTKNDSTFQLIIGGQDSTFHFWVAAVDNKGLRDPHPASNRYPVYNSPPSVGFIPGTEIADTSFTVASFAWTGTDPDGNNTITYYYWAINDTSNWHRVPATTTTLTLKQDSGIVPNSNNKLYLKAQDIAGSYSRIAKMPDSNKTWYVRAPVGNVLLINDYYRTAPTDVQKALNFYQTAFGSTLYSSLDIKVNGGGNIPKIKNPMFVETMKLFQGVVWINWRGNAAADGTNFDLAQQTLPFYMLSGGKVLFSTGFQTPLQSSDLANFASIDSISYNEYTGFTSQYPVIVIDNSYDTLYSGSTDPTDYNIDVVRTLYPSLTTHTIYNIANPNNPSQTGVVCVRDSNFNPHIVFMSLPLHRMNYTGSAVNFFRRVIHTDFGIN